MWEEHVGQVGLQGLPWSDRLLERGRCQGWFGYYVHIEFSEKSSTGDAPILKPGPCDAILRALEWLSLRFDFGWLEAHSDEAGVLSAGSARPVEFA